MSISKALTNDLERSLRLYRIPILTAMAFSMRRLGEDKFLLTDDKSEDSRRNVVRLRRITMIEQNSTKPGIGVDDRQFTSLTGNLIFTGLPDANGVAQPIGNVSNLGGRDDLAGTLFSATGTTDEKQAKAQRYNKRRPGDVSWRVRTPVMMADETSIIDYLAFRCTQLKYLHSITLKWSDRRWDTRVIGLDQDLYRAEGEKTNMVTLAPMWMDENMSILNPEIWGPFEDLIRMNYEEYLGRKIDEQVADCAAFTATFKDYLNILSPAPDQAPPSINANLHGRVQRLLDTTANRSLLIGFDRNILGDGTGNDTYKVVATDPDTAQDVTQDVFNLLDADGQWRLTSSFEAATLAEDGWCGTAMATQTLDIPPDLPAFAFDRAGNPVFGTKSVEVDSGFLCRRIVLPNGSYGLRLRLRSIVGDVRVEVIRNNRLRPKGWAMSQATARVTSIKHWRENYETVAGSTIRYEPGWREVFISFDLIDSLLVGGEGYPAHEVYIVLTADTTARFDHLELVQDTYGHTINILNTVNRSAQPFDTRPELRHVDLEKVFQADKPFGVREVAAASFRLDGKNTVVQAEHRPAYNIRQSGTTLDLWFKVNSDDETAQKVLSTRGSFTLFQKTGVYLPGYSCVVDHEKILTMGLGSNKVFDSTPFRNTLIHPSVGTDWAPPRIDWGNPNIYDTYLTCFRETGLQPLEWSAAGTVPINVVTPIGGGKVLLVALNDPYVTSGEALSDPASPDVSVSRYLKWHAIQAYSLIMPAARVDPAGTAGGFVFAPVPINPMLHSIASFYGDYNPSPAAFSPRFLFSPGSPTLPTSPFDHPSPAVVYSPAHMPSPGVGPLFNIPWPISPSAWGSPFNWPQDVFLYGPKPTWTAFAWDTIVNDSGMMVRYPIFVGGRLKFDRWVHLDIAMAENDLEIGINGITVYQTSSLNIPASAADNGDDLLIGTTTLNSTNVAAPVSFYSFKIFQRRLLTADRGAIFTGEATNFNELQYNVFKDTLDYDGDKVLDFWQNDITDFGLWTSWPESTKDPYRPFPIDIQSGYGKVVPSVADPITIATDLDRNRDLIADWYDGPYLQELIDIQAVGLSDGLILWDFMASGQAATYDYNDRVWDPTCKRYVPRTLSYLDWLRSVLIEEWNTVTAVQDPIPNFDKAGSPSPWKGGASPNPSGPWPTYGDKDNELVMTGVKGWFGFNGLIGYRDSLEKVFNEGVVFNYLQIELHFRAPRTELEALLKPYAHSIDDIFEDAYEGNRLAKGVPR